MKNKGSLASACLCSIASQAGKTSPGRKEAQVLKPSENAYKVKDKAAMQGCSRAEFGPGRWDAGQRPHGGAGKTCATLSDIPCGYRACVPPSRLSRQFCDGVQVCGVCLTIPTMLPMPYALPLALLRTNKQGKQDRTP